MESFVSIEDVFGLLRLGDRGFTSGDRAAMGCHD